MLKLCCSTQQWILSVLRWVFFCFKRRLMSLKCHIYQMKRRSVFHFVFWWGNFQPQCLLFVYLGNATQVVLRKESCLLLKQSLSDVGIPPFSVGFCLLSALFKQWWVSFRDNHTDHFLAGHCDAGQNLN